jgi:outer membrane protein assembly factor BamB
MNVGSYCSWAISGLIALATNGAAQAAETNPVRSLRALYAVNQATGIRGSIAVYDIDTGHRLLKTIQTVPEIHNVKGVAACAVTGKLYVSYYNRAGVGMIYGLDLANETILWNRKIDPGVDRLAIHPDGQLLYVPTGEDNTTDHINVVDANTGDIVRKLYLSKRSHDTQYPLLGPLFQETKAEDGTSIKSTLRVTQSHGLDLIPAFSVPTRSMAPATMS